MPNVQTRATKFAAYASRLFIGIAGAGILVLPALAEDHPCVRPQDQFVVALCSDPELRAIADQQRDAMISIWNRLSPEEQRRFRSEQLTWHETTARTCGIDQSFLPPLSVETKNCLWQAEARRIEFLRHYGQTDTPTVLHPNALPQVPSTASVAAADDHGTAAYQEGLRDRATWEEWFNSLQGDYKTGAFYWSSQRSLPHPGSCQQMNAEFTAGCTAAKDRLAPSDALRRSQPDYKLGWNAWAPAAPNALQPPSASTAPMASSAPTPASPRSEGEKATATPATSVPPADLKTDSGERLTDRGTTSQARWYVGHWDAEDCLAVDDIPLLPGEPRLYYGGGSLHTPEDFKNQMESLGTQITERSDLEHEGVKVYTNGKATGTPGAMAFIFFKDQDFCRFFMSHLAK